MRFLRPRTLAAAAVLAVGGLGLTGCHVPADVVCQYFIRPGHTLYSSYWSTVSDAYQCTSYIPGTGTVDGYTVYELPNDRWIRIG
jgi:hypothetical protein